jgi:carbamoyl-phosphate synthase small subunit
LINKFIYYYIDIPKNKKSKAHFMNKYKPAILALEDGTIFKGNSFGQDGEITGEIVFNTSMTGYQEIITDPSYTEQMVTFTYPLIGNYGINPQDVESKKISASAMIVRDYIDNYSNWRATMSLREYLIQNKTIGICNIDTRAVTRHIRTKGAMKAVISTENFDTDYLINEAQKYPGLVGRNLVNDVSCKEKYIWNEKSTSKEKIVVMDFGVKYNILRMLDNLGYQVVVVPAQTKADEILKMDPKGIMLSNGPGDPSPLTDIIEEIKKLLGKKPIFGICLGHQLMALALGAKTYKLKFGHRGGNHPVKDIKTGKVEITSQNHGFCVDEKTLDKNNIEITHINLYDGTLEGIEHKTLPLFTVQYHPEACPGPNDSNYLFTRFKELINNGKI